MRGPRGAVLFASALCAIGALCSPAEAAVTIGPTAAPDPNSSQAVGFSTTSILFNVRSYATIPVLAPVSGVITRWRLFTGVVTGAPTAQLRVLRPEGGVAYRVTRSGPPEVVSEVANGPGQEVVPHDFTAHLPIFAGEAIGAGLVHSGTEYLGVILPFEPFTSPWAWGHIQPGPADGDTGNAEVHEQTTGPSSDQYVMLNAAIEPDADGDTFGDETQDLCPADASTQGACPPGPDSTDPHVALAGVPASMPIGTFLKGIKAKLTPDEPVALRGELLATARTARISAFNLQLATKSAGLAAGPRTLKLKPSRKLVGHPRKRFKVRLRITATDAAGNATIVTKTFRVRPRR